MPAIRATFHRVTIRTKLPYLARLAGFGDRSKEPMIILVHTKIDAGRAGPPGAHATIISSPSNYPDLQPGQPMVVNNFRALHRMDLAGIPHSDAKPVCAACDRGDYQLGHAEDCPKFKA
jgi:hypothetical protein